MKSPLKHVPPKQTPVVRHAPLKQLVLSGIPVQIIAVVLVVVEVVVVVVVVVVVDVDVDVDVLVVVVVVLVVVEVDVTCMHCPWKHDPERPIA